MGFIGDLVKAILLTWIFFWIVATIWFFATEQLGIGLLFLMGLLIPSSFIIHEYMQYREGERNNV